MLIEQSSSSSLDNKSCRVSLLLEFGLVTLVGVAALLFDWFDAGSMRSSSSSLIRSSSLRLLLAGLISERGVLAAYAVGDTAVLRTREQLLVAVCPDELVVCIDIDELAVCTDELAVCIDELAVCADELAVCEDEPTICAGKLRAGVLVFGVELIGALGFLSTGRIIEFERRLLMS